MPSFCSSKFYFNFSKFDIVTYVTGCQRLTLWRTKYKHHLKDAACNSLEDGICLQSSPGGGGGIIFRVISP